MEQQESYSGILEKSRYDEPRRYKVNMLNDDFTTMDFVVMILTTIFFKSPGQAEQLMMEIHKKGMAVVGIYSYDIARSKVKKALALAQENGFPLRITITPEDE